MAKKLKKGDEVAWNTPQGETHGKVVEELTSPSKIAGHPIAASKEKPEYVVQSAKSGKRAAHRPEALRKK